MARGRRWTIGVVVLACAALSLGGCVARTMTVITEPAGAEVFISDTDTGRSPVVVPFTFYGPREIEVHRKGYASQRHVVELDTPWYQYFPMDFFVEVLWPFTVHDDHHYIYRLEPTGPIDVDAVRERAERVRSSFESGN